jgi:hypothetical protein
MEGLRPVLVGLALGLVAAGMAAASIRSMLFGIGPLDPLALGVVCCVLLAVAALAVFAQVSMRYQAYSAVVTMSPLVRFRVWFLDPSISVIAGASLVVFFVLLCRRLPTNPSSRSVRMGA